jgi:hypothetical protein
VLKSSTVMKRLPILLALASVIPFSNALAQTPLTSSTPVIGFYKFDVPVGTSIWTSGLVTKKAFQGQAESIVSGANSTLTRSGANWPAFPLHYVEILSGPQAGLILDILSNTSTTLTLKGATAPFNLTGTESFCVRAHATLGKLFKDGAGLIAGSDTVTLIRENGSFTYSFNGSNWEDGNFDDASNTIIYPGQAFLISHAGSGPATVTFGGDEVAYIKGGPTKIPLYPGIPNLVGLVNPLVSTNPADNFFSSAQTSLGNYGFVQSLVAGNDNIEIRSNNGTLTSQGVFQSNGTNLEDGNFDDASSVPVRNGAGLIIGVTNDGTWTAPPVPGAG